MGGLFPTLHQATQDLVAYHWSSFKSKSSALTLKVISSKTVAYHWSSFKSKSSALTLKVWKAVLAADNNKRHMWISRKVRYFVHKPAYGAYGFRCLWLL
eukprot:s249_g9.t1